MLDLNSYLQDPLWRVGIFLVFQIQDVWEIGPVNGGVQYNISQLFCEILISILLSNTGVIRMTGQNGSKYGHKFEV